MNASQLLKNSTLFAELSDAALDEISKSSEIVNADKNQILFFEGDEGAGFYLLAKGRVRLFKSAGYDRETTIRMIAPGEIFGEVVLFEKPHFPVSAESLDTSQLLFFKKTTFIHLLDDVAFRGAFCGLLMKKQRYLAERVKILSTLDIEERFLLYLVHNWGVKESYDVPFAKKDVALEIGTIPETFSRMLKRLQLKKVLSWNGSHVEIDIAYLEHILEEIKPG